jgi:hypothetical protein
MKKTGETVTAKRRNLERDHQLSVIQIGGNLQ